MDQLTYHRIPRVVSPHPLGLDIHDREAVPVRMRDDLDPYSPPAEYADGRVLWSGYGSREARDTARQMDDALQAASAEKIAREARDAGFVREAGYRDRLSHLVGTVTVGQCFGTSGTVCGRALDKVRPFGFKAAAIEDAWAAMHGAYGHEQYKHPYDAGDDARGRALLMSAAVRL